MRRSSVRSNRLPRWLWTLACVSAACSETGPVELAGDVQKGPFIVGSTLSIQAVDGRGNPTGETFVTRTRDDLGRFQIVLPRAGLFSLEASGFYFNEVTATLSAAPITLRAWALLSSDRQQATVNIMTHLAHGRTQTLLREGVPLDEAIDRAERETRAALGVGAPLPMGAPRGTTMSLLGGDTVGNGYLLALSAVLVQTAIARGGAIDAQLQELTNRIALDLEDDGRIDPGIVEELRASQHAIDPDRIMRGLGDRFRALGYGGVVPNPYRALDWDFDGIADLDDHCPRTPAGAFCFSHAASAATGPYPFLAAGDLDGDGRDELVAGEGYPERTAVTFRYLDGLLVRGAARPVGRTDELRLADFTRDGVADLLVYRPRGYPLSPATLSVYPGLGDGSFGDAIESPVDETSLGLLGSADLDRDGLTDLLEMAESGDSRQVRFVRCDGTGRFQAPQTILNTLNPYSPSVDDIDGDTKPDLALLTSERVPSSQPGVFEEHRLISLLRGNGDGTFGPVRTIGTRGAGSLALGDVDGDGHADLVSSEDDGTRLNWYPVLVRRGDGLGNFAPAMAHGSIFLGGTLHLLDADGDGKRDLLVANDHTVTVLLADGMGGFRTQSETPIASATDFKRFVPARIDADAAYDGFFSDWQPEGAAAHALLGGFWNAP